MNLFREMRTVFGVEQNRSAALGWTTRGPLLDLGAIGYEGYSLLSVFPTKAGRDRWSTERRLPLEPCCCVCGGALERRLSTRVGGWARWFGDGRPLLADIPHCSTHGAVGARLVVHVHYAEESYLSLALIGSHRGFLEATLERCRSDGEYEPPWIVFPGSDPYLGWNQGVQEAWMAEVWSRFWPALPLDRRADYLDEWQAPEEWRDRLNFTSSR